MNRIYKLVWNEISRTYIAVSETAKTSRSPTQSSTRLLCKHTDNRFAFRPGYLALVLAFSGQAAHAQITTQQRANGTNLVLDQPVNISLTASGSAGYALWAQNGGQITATTNQFSLASDLSPTLFANSGGKIILNGTGGLLDISNQSTSTAYPIVSVSGTGSEIDLTGALIHGNTPETSYNQVYGVLVNSAARFKLNESRISITGGTTDAQYGPVALLANDAGTTVNLTNTQIDLQTVSTRDGAIRGISANGQATVTGNNITINMNSGTTGPQNAIQSNGSGTNITLSNLVINGTTSARNYQMLSAVQAFSGGTITLNGGSISGNGIVNALSSNVAGSILTANDFDVSTTGLNGNQLVAAANGAMLNFTGGSITNTAAIGATTVIALVSNSVINLKNTSVRLGYGSQNTTGGIALHGFGPSRITADNTQISVNSNSSSLRAIGAYTESSRTDAQIQLSNGSSINLTGGYATTSGGLASYGVLVDGTRNVFTGSDSTITTTRFHPSQGAGVTAVSVQNSGYGAGTANLTRMEINANGNDSIGISAIGDSAQINLFASNHITTNGTNAHGLTVQNGAVISGANATGSKVLAQGTGSNALYFSGAATNTATLSGTSLTSTQATAINIASGTANISLDNGSVTSGNGTWLNVATGASANVTLNNGESVKGITQMGATSTSNLKVNTGSTWEITGASRLSSLAFDNGHLRFTANTPITTNTPVTLNAGGGFFNTNGFDIDFANQLQGIGQLQKNGAGTLSLSSANSNIGGVVVTDGTLEFTQMGSFTTTGNYTTQTGATTQIGATNSTLRIGGTLTQQAGSHLVMELGSTPDITANRAELDGDLAVAGFTFTDIPNLASAITSQDYTIIRTEHGIAGDFTSVDGTPGVPGGGLDYLITSGHKANLDKDYVLGFEMAWMKGGQTRGTGDFTLADGTGFTVDVSLEDQTFAGGNSDLGWNGQDLTKKGQGRLNLSTLNTYTGTTTIEEGDLYLSDAGNIESSTQVSLSSSSSTLDISLLSGNGTTIKNLDGVAQSQVVLGSKQLTVSSATDTTMAGNISGTGDLIKTGSSTLTLTGDNTYTGTTTISAGTLQIGDGATTGTLKSSGVANSAALIFNHNDNLEYAGILSGTGNLTKTGTGTLTLSGTGSSQTSVQVTQGTLDFDQPGDFSTTGNYTTGSGATTQIGGSQSTLNIGGIFEQQGGSHLVMELGASPDIQANTALLDGDLAVAGFTFTGIPNLASAITSQDYTIIRTEHGITGDFTSVDGTPGVPGGGLDYLITSGHKANLDKDYVLGFEMAWMKGGQTRGTGDFTLADGTGFTVDVSLEDQTFAGGNSDLGWNGRDLTKKGQGRLNLSTLNIYTGTTTIEEGDLYLSDAGNIESSAQVSLSSSSSTLDISLLSGNGTTIKNLDGVAQSQVVLGSRQLTVSSATDTTMAGNISGTGDLIKTGSSTLTLTGDNTYTGTTTISAGTLQIGDGATTGTLKSSGIANSASLIFNHNDDLEYAGILSGNGALSKLGTGTLSLGHANSTQGSVSVEAGVLNFKQNGTFNVQGDYATQSNATTRIGVSNSKLNITGTFTQKADSTLDVILGAKPDITAGFAKLDGNLVLSGFSLSDVPVKASELDQNPYTIIHTTGGITGDFVTHPSVVTGADYLVQKGSVSDNQMDYNLLLKLAWTQGGDAEGTGSFTMQNNTGLDVDISLTDQTPTSFFVSGWDGRSLTKSGEGQLTLSTLNRYTGDTTITGGSLLLKGEGDISSSNSVTLRGSATGKTYLDISGISAPSTTLNNLSGTVDSQLTLGGKTLAINNNLDTIFAGNFDTSAGSITKTGAGELVLSGQTLWTGDTHLDQGSLTLDGSQGGGRLDSNIVGQTNTRLQLVNGAILTGWIDPTDVSLDSASTWNMSASSLVNHLTNAGKISILPPTGSSFSTLTIQGNYTGNNGLIVLNTKLGADDSATDKLIVNGNTSGTTQVKIKNTGGRGAQTSKGIEIIKVEGQSQGQFTLANRVVAGAYEYSLNQGQADLADGNWYLRSAGSKSRTPQFRPESGAYLGNQSLTDTMQMHTLYDRQGSRGTQANKKAWGRIISGQINSSAASKNVDVDSDYTLVQFGSDLFAVNDGKQLLQIGLMGSWGDGNTDTIGNADPYGKRHSAKGTVTGYSAGVYATWFADGQTREGAYADSWLQYGWYDNDVKSNGMKTKSYDAQRFTASVEAGYNFILGNVENETPLHLTPQAQIAYSRYRVDPLTDSHDTIIDGQNTNQWNSRLGVRASYSTNPLQPFVELNWLHSSQKQSVHFHDVQISQDKPKNLPELKLGFQGELSKKLSGWARISAQDDFKDYQRFEATAGILYVW